MVHDSKIQSYLNLFARKIHRGVNWRSNYNKEQRLDNEDRREDMIQALKFGNHEGIEENIDLISFHDERWDRTRLTKI